MLCFRDEFGIREVVRCYVLDAVERNALLNIFRRKMGSIADGAADGRQRQHIPIVGNDAHLGLLVSGPQFHTAPIFSRCRSTRTASESTSSMSLGSGVA